MALTGHWEAVGPTGRDYLIGLSFLEGGEGVFRAFTTRSDGADVTLQNFSYETSDWAFKVSAPQRGCRGSTSVFGGSEWIGFNRSDNALNLAVNGVFVRFKPVELAPENLPGAIVRCMDE